MRRFLVMLTSLLLLAAFTPTFAPAKEVKEKKKAKVSREDKGKKGKKEKGKKAQKEKPSRRAEKTVPKPAVVKPVAPPEPAVKAHAVVNEIRHWSNPDYTRIVISLDRETRYEYHQLPRNGQADVLSRLYIDFAGTRLSPGIRDLPVGDGFLKTARVAQYNSDTVRVVLDMQHLKEYKVFTFSDPFRLIIDIKGERKSEISAVKEGVEAQAVIAPLARKDKEDAVVPVKAVPAARPGPKEKKRSGVIPGKIRRVVVDPGHGGHDPGAVGQGGTREKDVVLQIGLKLAQRLREDLGLDVVMTRSTDVFLELQERTAIANQVGADLFVSIHANAALNRSASGIETYYLNLAKTEKAAQLAALENGTSLEKVSLLQAVLFDLMANYKLNDSAHLADEVQKSLHKKVNGSFSGVKNLGVKQGPFYVLVGATMPSILVETAFLSNEREEERLQDSHYHDVTAEGITAGIKAYIANTR